MFRSVHMVLCAGFLLLILLLLVKMVYMSFVFDREKQTPYECGFSLLVSLRVPLSVHFFLVGIIFLIFDVEMILILPFFFVVKCWSIFWIGVFFSCFVLVLLFGLIYECLLGLLNWLV